MLSYLCLILDFMNLHLCSSQCRVWLCVTETQRGSLLSNLLSRLTCSLPSPVTLQTATGRFPFSVFLLDHHLRVNSLCLVCVSSGHCSQSEQTQIIWPNRALRKIPPPTAGVHIHLLDEPIITLRLCTRKKNNSWVSLVEVLWLKLYKQLLTFWSNIIWSYSHLSLMEEL